MNERIKKLRKVLGLTQQEFADKIGMKRNTIANYETNRNEPSNSVISLICRTFNVSEDWLRQGDGEMFSPVISAALEALARERSMTFGDYAVIEKFLSLNPHSRQIIVNFMLEVAATLNSSETPADYIMLRPSKNSATEIAKYAQDVRLLNDLKSLENFERLFHFRNARKEENSQDSINKTETSQNPPDETDT